MGLIITVLIFICLVFIHELSHYLVARLFGMKPTAFGFGMPWGPRLTLFRAGGTEFRLHLLFIGGYVEVPELDADLDGEDTADTKPPAKRFPLWQKLAVAVSGIIMYVVAAWIFIVASLLSFGVPVHAVEVDRLASNVNPIAENAGIRRGDRLLSLDGEDLKTPERVVSLLRSKPETPVMFKIERDGGTQEIRMTTNPEGKVGMALITVEVGRAKADPINCIAIGGQTLVRFASQVFAILPTVGQHQQTPEGMRLVGWTVLLFANEVFRQNPQDFLTLMSMLSLDLALIQLLPLPGLDGSHILSIIYKGCGGKSLEGVAKKICGWVFVIFVALSALGGQPTCLLRGKDLGLDPD